MKEIIEIIFFTLFGLSYLYLIIFIYKLDKRTKTPPIIEPPIIDLKDNIEIKELYRNIMRNGSYINTLKHVIEKKGVLPIIYDLEVDTKKTHEINENIIRLIFNAEKYQNTLLETEVIKEIIKRGHPTFYINRCGEFWSKPDSKGGYLIYKKGDFFDKPKK